jgi:hypothetical protein
MYISVASIGNFAETEDNTNYQAKEMGRWWNGGLAGLVQTGLCLNLGVVSFHKFNDNMIIKIFHNQM